MTSTRWRAEASVAILFAVVLLIVAGGAVWFGPRMYVHEDPSTVPSTPADAPKDTYARPVEASRQLARALVVGDRLPGLSVAVAVNGEIAWAEGFGWSGADRRTPLTPQARFRLGALSKPVTAIAAARLHDQRQLDLDVPVQRYVPAYPEKTWTVTTRQLLGDLAGVHRIRGDNNDAMPTTHCDRLDDAVALLADDPLLFEPGTRHRYSVWGWVLVSAAVQGAAGQPFERYMERSVFEPLGMTRTVTEETDGLVDVAQQASGRPDYSCLAGGGAFLSSPTDLVRLGSAMLKPGFLRADTIADFQRPTRIASGASTTYALGWTVASVPIAGKPVRVVSHRGSPADGSATLLTFPDLGLAVAVAANATDAKGIGPFALEVADTFSRQR